MSKFSKALLIFSLISAGIFLAAWESEQRQQKRLEAEHQAEELRRLELQQKISEFQSSKTKIISQAVLFYEKRDFSAVLSQLEPYAFTGDKDILDLKEKAEKVLRKKRESEEIERILTRLKKIPASQYKLNRDLYFRLTELVPENKLYIDKYNYYQKKHDEKTKKSAALARLRGERPVRSSWDGSYLEVKNYLKLAANDPDSIEIDGCTGVYTVDEGSAWLVGCNYRGRNGFGGMVRQSNWFKIVQGRVISMESADAYDP